MIRIGNIRLGFAVLSTIAVFVSLSACAIIAAVKQENPDFHVPLSKMILFYERIALLATLVYGICVHFALVIIDRIKNRRK